MWKEVQRLGREVEGGERGREGREGWREVESGRG
jgi:hypothetical protein